MTSVLDQFPALRLRPMGVSLWQRLFSLLVWSYFFGLLTVWGLLALSGDRWWFATVMLFAPRWIYALPLVALLPLTLLARRWRLLSVLAATMVIVLGPIMDLCLPLGSLCSSDGPSMRVVSINFDGDHGNPRKLKALLNSENPELFAIQECPVTLDDEFFAPWYVRRSGQLVVGSRHPIGDVCAHVSQTTANPWPRADAICIQVETPAGPLRFCSIHLRTPRDGLGQVLSRKIGIAPWRKEELKQGIEDRRAESTKVAEWLEQFQEPVIVAGDFNMPADSGIYRDTWTGYTNAYSTCGWGYGYTKWTPLGPGSYGLRIDHILTGGDVKVRRVWLGRDVGSDHLPMLADLCMPPSPAGPLPDQAD